MVGTGIALLILPIGPAMLGELRYYFGMNSKLEMMEAEIGDTDFRVLISKIGLDSGVIENIDMFKPEEYKRALKQGIAHAKGSGIPGEAGNVYLFGHSTNFDWNAAGYNAEFYLLNKLVSGDLITLIYNGNQYRYQVKETKIVRNENLSVLDQPESGKLLTLQTCWPPGTTWRRLIVVAEEVS
jgi:sortase A